MPGNVTPNIWNQPIQENSREERERARLTVAACSTDQAELKELLAILGLGLTLDEWTEWKMRKGWDQEQDLLPTDPC